MAVVLRVWPAVVVLWGSAVTYVEPADGLRTEACPKSPGQHHQKDPIADEHDLGVVNG